MTDYEEYVKLENEWEKQINNLIKKFITIKTIKEDILMEDITKKIIDNLIGTANQITWAIEVIDLYETSNKDNITDVIYYIDTSLQFMKKNPLLFREEIITREEEKKEDLTKLLNGEFSNDAKWWIKNREIILFLNEWEF